MLELVNSYTFDTYAGAPTSSLAIVRYSPTLDNAGNNSNGATNVTGMSELQDWVFSVTFSHWGTDFTDTAFVLKAKEGLADETQILRMDNDGAGNYTLYADKGTVTVASLGDLNSGTEAFHYLVVHYKADGLGGGAYDAYLDDNQIASNVASAASIDHAADFFSMFAYTGSNDKWRQIRLGQAAAVPEPAMMALVGLGTLMLRRRRSGIRSNH